MLYPPDEIHTYYFHLVWASSDENYNPHTSLFNPLCHITPASSTGPRFLLPKQSRLRLGCGYDLAIMVPFDRHIPFRFLQWLQQFPMVQGYFLSSIALDTLEPRSPETFSFFGVISHNRYGSFVSSKIQASLWKQFPRAIITPVLDYSYSYPTSPVTTIMNFQPPDLPPYVYSMPLFEYRQRFSVLSVITRAELLARWAKKAWDPQYLGRIRNFSKEWAECQDDWDWESFFCHVSKTA